MCPCYMLCVQKGSDSSCNICISSLTLSYAGSGLGTYLRGGALRAPPLDLIKRAPWDPMLFRVIFYSSKFRFTRQKLGPYLKQGPRYKIFKYFLIEWIFCPWGEIGNNYNNYFSEIVSDLVQSRLKRSEILCWFQKYIYQWFW